MDVARTCLRPEGRRNPRAAGVVGEPIGESEPHPALPYTNTNPARYRNTAMNHVHVLSTLTFPGHPETAYAILRDYHDGHPSILPARSFTHLVVEEGGYGDGTVIRFGLKLMGRVQEARATVSEPEPGRVLLERIDDPRGTETRFTVEAAGDGATRATIQTTWRVSGLAGWVEQRLAPRLLMPIYREELANLAAAVVRKEAMADA